MSCLGLAVIAACLATLTSAFYPDHPSKAIPSNISWLSDGRPYNIKIIESTKPTHRNTIGVGFDSSYSMFWSTFAFGSYSLALLSSVLAFQKRLKGDSIPY